MPSIAVPLVSLVGVAVGAVASLVATALLVGYLLRRDPETFLAPERLRERDGGEAHDEPRE